MKTVLHLVCAVIVATLLDYVFDVRAATWRGFVLMVLSYTAVSWALLRFE